MDPSSSRLLRNLAGVLVSALWLAAALAEAWEAADPKTVEIPPAESPWRFRLAPYAWVTSTYGTIGIRGLNTDVDAGMADTLSNLDGALMMVAEVGYRHWSLENDVIFARLGLSANSPGPLFGQVDATLTQVIWTSFLGYRVIEEGPFTADIQAGFRLIHLSQEIELTSGLLPGTSRTLARTWIDPVLGLRTRWQVTGWLFVSLRGDIGGFGANSELTWQGYAGLGAQISRWAALLAGYRALGYRYNQAGFLYDTVTHGPVIGIECRF